MKLGISSGRIAFLLLLACAAPKVVAQNSVAVVTLNHLGGQIDPDCHGSAMSANGRCILFRTNAGGVVPEVPTATTGEQMYLRDLLLGTTELVSISTTQTAANGASGTDPELTADGRYVVFESRANNLVTLGPNVVTQVYVRDRVSNSTTLVSVSTTGGYANQDALRPRISDDGRFVLFQSSASNLKPGDTSTSPEYFLRDLVSSTTTAICPSMPVNASTLALHDISGDGAFLAVVTTANLVPPDTSGTDVYVIERATGIAVRESVAYPGASGAGTAEGPARLSGDGSVVAFNSYSDKIVPGDTVSSHDLFVRNRTTGITECANVGLTGAMVHNPSVGMRLSRDGRFVAFPHFDSMNLCGAVDFNGWRDDVFVRDRSTGTTRRGSEDGSGIGSLNQFSVSLVGMSNDGAHVAFGTSQYFIPEDVDFQFDVFVRDLTLPSPEVFCFGLAGTCPCGNGGLPWQGCSNGSGFLGADLRSYNQAYVSNDQLVIQVRLATAFSPILLFQGTDRVNGGLGVPFGDGLRCVAGFNTRLLVRTADSQGVATFGPSAGDLPISVLGSIPTSGGPMHYQAWYRDTAIYCTSALFNTSSAVTVPWLP